MEATFDSNGFAMKADRFTQRVGNAALAGLKATALRIVNNAKSRLKDNTSVVTGHLRASGSVKPQKDGTVDAGFYSEYAAAVEYGRKAGKMPPVDMIAQWVRKKHIAFDPKEIVSIAWAYAKSIAKKGTKPHPFLYPAFKEEIANLESDIADEINAVIEQERG